MSKRASLKGLGAEIFFPDDGASLAPPPAEDVPPSETAGGTETAEPAPIRSLQTTRARPPEREPASVRASVLAPVPDEVVSVIRQVVKDPGKEVLYVRLTAAEKGQLADIAYTYKRQGKKTSDTEIGRIAVNYLMQDYQANGANSVLARVIDALLA